MPPGPGYRRCDDGRLQFQRPFARHIYESHQQIGEQGLEGEKLFPLRVRSVLGQSHLRADSVMSPENATHVARVFVSVLTADCVSSRTGRLLGWRMRTFLAAAPPAIVGRIGTGNPKHGLRLQNQSCSDAYIEEQCGKPFFVYQLALRWPPNP